MDVQKFTASVVSIVVVVIIAVTVLIPILGANQVADNTIENAEAINAMLNVIPILVIVGIIIAVVGMFLYTRRN